MDDQKRLNTLSEFLKIKRAQIKPESIGLPPGNRRRTPGLRREEVARLSGVSTTWYTWLEQGRDIKVSPEVLEAVAKTLRLNQDEKDYLYDLAYEKTTEIKVWNDQQPEISHSLKHILDELTYCPSIVTDRRCFIVGWNAAASHVFIDFNQIPAEERNLIRLLFARKEFKALATNWDHFVKGFLAIFRSYYGHYLGDEWYNQFIEEMNQTYPEFKALWQESQVSKAPEMQIEFRHVKAGKMLFDLTSMRVQGDADLRCSIYTPVYESGTEEKLRKLMKKVADE
ncbi:helix-turn-helix transcriptional regulator [Staphylococcus pettenkoferi]|uniref:helix-turn-helix transcriptional regulator n=1 Tax=Staphylococcus pettenkoferi TaxID=170573 RepID=UPI0011A2D34E|nr:helix-turn-helix transcriptional regulator [Staphylococcus pettenkoferi]MCI2803612.1 helix-turn-helix transcriptional regulator [Staphylococcus pettenkoferi]MCY1615041.1 helix-turn-helix transcriptional regulator [Staphylococcus pettenkoferi]